MPKRAATSYRVDSSEIQGEDSYIVLRYLTLGEQERAFKGDYPQHDLLTDHVLKWNWVDDNGKPLGELPAAINDLYTSERDFIMDALFQIPEDEEKN